MEKAADLVSLQVLVPRDRIAEFYAMHSQWLSGAPAPSPLARPSPRLLALDSGEEPRAWNEGDEGERVADALIVYDKLSKGAKRIIDVLVQTPMPGGVISGDYLSSLVDMSADQLTGTLASVGIRSKGVNRKMPLDYRPAPDGGEYSIDPGGCASVSLGQVGSP